MAHLGLLPPYTSEDIEQAYRSLAAKAHPDRGGTAADFIALQSAYEHAKEYVEFRADKRQWIAAHVEEYGEAQRVAAELQRMGAEVTLSVADWLQRSFGDFAQLAALIEEVVLRDSRQADAAVEYMVQHASNLRGLRLLDLSGSHLTEDFVGQLKHFEGLVELNLSRTPAGRNVLALVRSLPRLDHVDLTGTQVGWLARSRIKRLIAKRLRDRPLSVLRPQ